LENKSIVKRTIFLLLITIGMTVDVIESSLIYLWLWLFSGARVVGSSIFCVVCCRPLFLLLSFFF